MTKTSKIVIKILDESKLREKQILFRIWIQNQYESIGFSQGNLALNSEANRKQNLGSQVKLEQGLEMKIT